LLQHWCVRIVFAGMMVAVASTEAAAQASGSTAGSAPMQAGAPAVVAGGTVAAAAAASEERVKAASLYKFLNYISWPPTAFLKPDAPYVIGVAGADEVADNLEQLVAGHRVADRQVAVRRVRPGEPPAGVHVLFVGRGERHRLPQILRHLQGQPVLVVTEGEGGTAGGMINFRVVDERVRFEVALEPVEKAGLKLDSRMLAVALSVNKGALQ
jgi:hypothetical protein